MEARTDILIRPARRADVASIDAVEKAIYGPLGTDVFGQTHFNTWLDVFPDGFSVAEYRGRVVGYHYAQCLDRDPFAYEELRPFAEMTDHGMTVGTHQPDGMTVQGVSIVSVLPGAGRRLFEDAFARFTAADRRFYLGFSRMPGLGGFLTRLISARISYVTPREAVAHWYALMTAAAVGGGVWPSAKRDFGFCLPAPNPDPVLAKQLRHPGYRLAGIMTGCMRDPQSADCAAILVRTLAGSRR